MDKTDVKPNETDEKSPIQGFLNLARYYPVIFFVAIIILLFTAYDVLHASRYVDSCNSQWISELKKYNCYDKAQSGFPYNPLLNFSVNKTLLEEQNPTFLDRETT